MIILQNGRRDNKSPILLLKSHTRYLESCSKSSNCPKKCRKNKNWTLVLNYVTFTFSNSKVMQPGYLCSE